MTTLPNFITHKYSRQGLQALFLTCAFPFHFWTLILVFRDISWLTERTNLWDAIGVASYGMIFAFIESALVFLIVVLAGFVIPKWQADRRIAFLGLLILLTAVWGMISQLLFIWNVSLPVSAIQFLRNSGHALRIMYAVCLSVVSITVLLPIYFFIRSRKSVMVMQGLMDRLSLLTMLYLFFDVLGLVIVIIRNIS
jgi:hypothetical protein